MELEEMKTLWEEMSQKVEKQQVLTDTLIMEMTQRQYRSRFNKISLYEGTGTVICYLMALALIIQVGKFDTWYLTLMAVFTAGYLFVMPFLVMRSIFKIQKLDIAKDHYKDTLVQFTKAKRRLLFNQRLAIPFNFLLVFMIVPVFDKLFNGDDMIAEMIAGTGEETSLWFILTIIVTVVFMILVSRWGYRHYKRITSSAENLLKELDR